MPARLLPALGASITTNPPGLSRLRAFSSARRGDGTCSMTSPNRMTSFLLILRQVFDGPEPGIEAVALRDGQGLPVAESTPATDQPSARRW